LSYDDRDKIIQSLIDDKFLDEKRYTGFYVRDKYKFNKWGRVKISHHLKQKQIPEYIIMEAFDSISEKLYEENLEEILASKMRSTREEDPYKLKAKLYRFAQSRGFESNLILRNIEKLVHKD
jgi:regulatory protein